MTRPAVRFAIKQPTGSWSPCAPALNTQLAAALHDFAGAPGTVTVRDEHGDVHTLSAAAGHVLSLALLAMDARLRPGGCYRAKADEVYAALAKARGADAVAELRRVFGLGAKRPWLVP